MIDAVFWFLLALVFALIEIESEGKHGWAAHMPTWYRVTGWPARMYGMLMGGKPLTGYHLFMFFMPLMVFHAGFFLGVPWSAAAEFRVIALYFAWAPVWDYLWFIMNPHYGIQRFRQETVWWHRKSYWILDAFPHDYAVGWVLALIVAYTGQLVTGTVLLVPTLQLLGVFTILLFMTILLAPLYHDWYKRMRAFDERDQCDIS